MKSLQKIGIAAGITMIAFTTPAFAEGDAAKGESVFRKCASCHSLEEGKNGVGPSLFGIYEKTAGTKEGYRYSKINAAAAEAGLVWNTENLMVYLADPQKFLKGYLEDKGLDAPGRTKMAFKLRKDTERADVIAYLKSLGS